MNKESCIIQKGYNDVNAFDDPYQIAQVGIVDDLWEVVESDEGRRSVRFPWSHKSGQKS